MPHEPSPFGKRLTVQYSKPCKDCGIDVPVGVQAFWYPDVRPAKLQCLSCNAQQRNAAEIAERQGPPDTTEELPF